MMTHPEVQQLLVAVARVETKLDLLHDRSLEDREAAKLVEKRVDLLEAWRNWLAGAWAVLATLLAFIGIRIS